MGEPPAKRKEVTKVDSEDEEQLPQRPGRRAPLAQKKLKDSSNVTSRTANTRKTARRAPSDHSSDSEAPRKSRKAQQPAKNKAAGTKSKASTGAKAPPKPKDKSIYSFFNTATQRQQSQRSTSPDKPPAITPEDEDSIHDDSVDEKEQDRNDSGPSSIALAVRKRKRGVFEESNGSTSSSLPGSSQKFLTHSVPPRPNLPSRSAEENKPWNERFVPQSLDELAVHKKKVADVRGWLDDVFSGRSRKRLLVLRGGAGAGKTTTLQLLSKELGFELKEWRNPSMGEFSSDGYVSLSAHFDDFINRTGKFGSLDFDLAREPVKLQTAPKSATEQSHAILIEEFPHSLGRSTSALQNFRSTTLRYLATNVPSMDQMFSHRATPNVTVPVIMVISETLVSNSTVSADSFTAHRVLGSEILSHPGVSVIEFNPIAPTILSKALDLVIVKEARKSGRRKAPGPQVMKHLSEIGDVRNAVSSLEFLCVRGDEGSGWGGKVTFTKPRKASKDVPLTKMEQESLELVSQRESNLGIFHAVGKVVYNKREAPPSPSQAPPQPPTYLPQHRRTKVPEVDSESLINELGTDTQTFISALHENYALSCNGDTGEETMDYINGCIDGLSDADLLSPDRFSAAGSGRRTFQGAGIDSLRQDEISFHVAVRGMLFNLPSPVKRLPPPAGITSSKGRSGRVDAVRMFYPTSLKLWRRREEIEGLLDLCVARMQSGLMSMSPLTASLTSVGASSGVESWARHSAFTGSIDPGIMDSQVKQSDEEKAMLALPRLGADGSARREMLLQHLPYLAMICRRRALEPGFPLCDLETIIHFSRAVIQADESSDDEEQMDLETPKTSNSIIGGSASADSTNGASIDSSLRKKDTSPTLVLSDDDIEDD